MLRIDGRRYSIMQYSEGSFGRIFVIRLDHGEDLIESLQRFAREKNVECCAALFMGALRDGRAVTGPVVPQVPPAAHFEDFQSAWEVFGMASIYPSTDGPKMHIHSALGRGREALLGCLREKVEVYLVVEAILFEICGTGAERIWDEQMQLYLLNLSGRTGPAPVAVEVK